MKLGWKRNLEENVLHDIRAQGATEREWFAARENIVKSPVLCRQCRRIAHLALHGHERETNPSTRGVASRPRLARTGVRRVPVHPKTAAIGPGIRNSAYNLILGPAEHCSGDSGRGNPNQQHVIEANAVKAILESEDPLNFVGPDHSVQNIPHGECALSRPAEIVSQS